VRHNVTLRFSDSEFAIIFSLSFKTIITFAVGDIKKYVTQGINQRDNALENIVFGHSAIHTLHNSDFCAVPDIWEIQPIM
jgi:hypothetical protein